MKNNARLEIEHPAFRDKVISFLAAKQRSRFQMSEN
jgi:hypothetical protein